jgi:hypothetical protein
MAEMTAYKQKLEEENGPTIKRGKSSFIYFSMEIRNQIKAENPEMPQKLILTEIGKRWKSLTAEEK